ncbi:MAG: hypothetical protein ALAOOOJD_03638 [bacterium]|nr:hypothetical protein [bacterium]
MKRLLILLHAALLPYRVEAQAAKTYQIAENHLTVRFTEQNAAPQAREVLEIAAQAQQQLAEKYQIDWATPIAIRLSTTTYEFCQLTGQPWWQAAISQQRVIYLQPLRLLRDRGILETTLRHELVHQLVEAQSKGSAPRWLNEALAIYNSGEIAQLKPARHKAGNAELEWSQLEKRLESKASKAEAERVYFQLYYLGQFLETAFTPAQMMALLLQLAEKKSFDLACKILFHESAATLEKRWLLYASEKIN